MPAAAHPTPPLAPAKLLIFDLDGTLVDSLSHVIAAFTHALAPYRPDLSPEQIFLKLGGPPPLTLRELIGDEAKAAEALVRLYAYGFGQTRHENPFPGATRLVHTLQSRGVTLAIWTGRDRAGALHILRSHDLESLFALIVCGDDLATHKPHPEGLRVILHRLGFTPQETVFFGDADADVLGGHAAGLRTVLIRHQRQITPQIATLAWRVVSDPTEAYALALTVTAG